MKAHRYFVRLLGVIVPRRLRSDWRQEWEAELQYREESLARWDQLNRRNKLDLLWHSAGAFMDALALQPRRLEDEMFQDLRYGSRLLAKRPGFTLMAVLTLALGIGASTAIFSAVNPILFEPLPYPNAARIMMIWYFGADGSRAAQTFGTYSELAKRSRSFDAISVFKTWQPTMTGPSEPERLDGQQVSAGYFRALGVPPALGADFDPADDTRGGSKVAIVSDTLWHRRFDGDRAIIGTEVKLDDNLYTVIGVMPSGFENVLGPSAEIWSLLQYDALLPPQSREWGHHLHMVARLRPGVGRDEAKRELDQIASTPMDEFPRQPGSSMNRGLIVNSLQDDVTRGVKPTLQAVVGAVLLLLTIACVNVTNLLLARGAQRRGEFAMRTALGAARLRLIRQLLTESLLMALLGGAFGMLIAEIGVRALVALSPPGLPRVNAIAVNGPVFIFALCISTIIGVAVGLIPALRGAGLNLRTALEQSSRGAIGGHHLMRRALVVAEVALALVLLVSAGLLLQSLRRLFAVTPGFDSSHLITMQVQTYGKRFDDDNVCRRFFAQALDAARRVPGVTTAAFTSQLPLSGDDAAMEVYGVELEDRANTPASVDAYRYAVTPDYFSAMGIRLIRGRLFDESDMRSAPVRPVLVSESFAKRAFPDGDPIGKRVRFGGPPGRAWDTIVGVVGDVRQVSLAEPRTDAVYITTGQWLWADGTLWLVARSRGDAASLASAIRQSIWSVDRDEPIVRVATMDDRLVKTAAERRFALILFETFGLVALVLAATGIYGVLSGSVTERTSEIGVRLALGASTVNILNLVLRQGMVLTVIGVVIGLSGAVVATSALGTLLFETSRLDLVTYLGVIALLAAVSAVACWAPARRAARVDPLLALRSN